MHWTWMPIFGLNDLLTEVVGHMSSVDFGKSNTATSKNAGVLELTILGGLLSTYEMNDRKFSALLKKIKQLADKLAFACVRSLYLFFTMLIGKC